MYSSILRAPGVSRLVLSQLLARFPGGMISLAVLIHIQHIHHSYAAAGAVLAAISVGQAVAGPLTSRAMGKWGMRPVLIITTVVCGAGMLALAFLPVALIAEIGIGLVIGIANPPIQSAVRTIYPKIVPSKLLTPLFSLDASAQEIIWVVGPVVATILAFQVGPQWAILAAVLALAVGGAWFISSRELGEVRIPKSRRKLGQVLRVPTVVLSASIGLLLVAACAAIEAGTIAVFGHEGPDSGLVLAVFAIGSLVGGFAIAEREIRPLSLFMRMSVVFVGIALTCISQSMIVLMGALLLAGFGVAPAFAAMNSSVSSQVKFSDTAEAYGWVNTGQLVGAAAGSALAGTAIDVVGPVGGFVIAAIIALLGALLPLLAKRWLPDLRGRDSTPIPDTEPVTMPS